MRRCRICKSEDLEAFLSLGRVALANSFLDKSQLDEPEEFYPLTLCFCKSCSFVQLAEVVPPEKLFKNYIYVSGTSSEARKHFEGLAGDVMGTINPPKKSLIVEFASNDGTLLKNFKKFDARILGVEPAENIAPLAEAAGVPTINDFFSERVAKEIAKTQGRAKAIIGTNVFAHIPDLDEVMRGFHALLDEDGVIVIESPYLVNLLEKVEYDTIYHEHVSYLSLSPLVRLFDSHGFRIFDAKRTTIHGGSIRIFACRKGAKFKEAPSVAELLALERKLALNTIEPYREFAYKVQRSRIRLLETLYELKRSGKSIVGYGAAAKGNTLLNYCNIGPDILAYIADKSPHKQGKYTPGTNIPVVHPDVIMRDKPDYMLILAWNFADEIMREQAAFKNAGGRFVLPIPEAKIV